MLSPHLPWLLHPFLHQQDSSGGQYALIVKGLGSMGRQEGTSVSPGSDLVAPLCAERGADTPRDKAAASNCLPPKELLPAPASATCQS